MDLRKITHEVVELSKTVGQFIRQEAGRITTENIKEKGVHDLVTYVDLEAEKRLVSALQIIVPEAGFIAEENQKLKRKEGLNWIIDPLDGTTNFIHGVPNYCVSIALAEREEIISAVVYEINLDECFYAWKDGPAFLNGNEIKVSSTKVLEKSLIATGFPYSDYSLLKPYLGLFEELLKDTRGIRRLGSAALDLAYVACGRFDLFFEYGLKPWDVAAGSLIVERAGGLVTDFKEKDNYIFGRQIIASNKKTHDEFSKKLNRHFTDHI
ncbi:MAG: inositol monophosphatase [Bacteroidetes bacterium]|nr:MAG: inositol monophosphatase [Bacteroidota bacterium]